MRRALPLLVALGLAGVPLVPASADEARLESLQAQLAADPGRLDTRFAYAQALSWAKRWDEALAEYDRLLAVVPDDPDYLLGKAQVLAWSGRPADALPLLKQASRRAPDYGAVARLEAQVREQLAARPAQSLAAGVGWQDLSRGLPDWRTQYIDYLRQSAPGHALYAGLRRTERFDAADVQGSAGWSRPWGDAWNFTLEGALAPGADVLPRWSGRFRLGRALDHGWGVHGSLYQAGYAADDLTTVAVGAERYAGPWYAGVTAHASRLQGAGTTWSGQLRADRYYDSDSRVGLIVAAGRETESIGDGRFITSSTRGLVLLGQHRWAPQWSLSWELLVHEQGDAYTRKGFHVGLRRDF